MRTLVQMGMLEDLVKEAIISVEEHKQDLVSDLAKEKELAKLRGTRGTPMKQVVQPTQAMYQKFLREEAAQAKAMGDTARYQEMMAEMKTPSQKFPTSAKPVAVPDIVNAPRIGIRQKRVKGTVVGPTPLREAEVVKSYNPYASSNVSRIKHRWVNPVRRFFGTPAGKAVGIGGAVGAAGLGLYHFLNSNKTPQPENYQLSPEQQDAMQQEMYGMPQKMGAFESKVTIPRPTPVPKIPAPGPSVAGIPQAKRDATSIGAFSPSVKTPGVDASKGFGSPGSSSGKTSIASDIDPSIAPLLAGGVGGLGGYLAGSKLLAPWMEDKENDILKEIAEKQKSVGNWQTARKFTPIAMAALGAVTLAAIAAMKARSDERSKMQAYQMLAGHLRPYDPTNSGYGAADQVPMGASSDKVYD